MKKNVVAAALLSVALCMGLAACSSAPAANQSDGAAVEAEAGQEDGAAQGEETGGTGDAAGAQTTPVAADAQAENANPPAANGFGGPIPEYDQNCLSCHESYEAVAEKTAHYGDSNPHNSVHGSYETCENCHAADKVINEDHKCLSCHAWPRTEDGHL